MKYLVKILMLVTLVVALYQCSPLQNSPLQNDQWAEDFNNQPIVTRPGLEVNYTDSSRTAFNIRAQDYRLVGQLQQPHLLSDDQGTDWLWMEMKDAEGKIYSTKRSNEKSRINLYRRGPYFCEIHWFDLQLAAEDGTTLPLKGDLALYAYPEKLLAEITWHATEDFAGATLEIKGKLPTTIQYAPIVSGQKASFAFPVFAESEPLSDRFLSTRKGKMPLHYDARKGYYVVGTETSDSFQRQFYEFPNRYETASITVKNDDKPKKIYISHQSVVGGAIVEGGVILNEEGQPMPITVQVSKNFDGEKEEKFYNPLDTAFSETFFPLYLEPNEEVSLSSLHVYQNWGQHMTKHWSSLGAWMDYFHSSTGVTETTCYVPFKFGGIGGVSIADFRAMSQEAFWKGQPQHDNLAGHSFLSFYDGDRWQHAKYESTVYRSTGPNWYDIQLNYISTDGSIKITADIWETPQLDELRSFFKVKYEVLKPLTIKDAQAHFRFLSVTSTIQGLRFNRLAASGVEDMAIDFAKSPFPIKGIKLPAKNAFVAEYGDSIKNRGANAIILREFSGPQGIGPAVTVQTGPYKNRFKGDSENDTRMLIVPDKENLELKAGDIFTIDGYWLPYGECDNAATPRKETGFYAVGAPKVTNISIGNVVSDLPVKIEADDNEAQFSIKGGKDLIPVIVTGLTEWKYPRIWKKEDEKWRLLSHARNSEHDGYQVFSEGDGKFGTIFLVSTDDQEQHLKVSVGNHVNIEQQIVLHEQLSQGQSSPGTIAIKLSDKEASAMLAYPGVVSESAIEWKKSEGNSLWFEQNEGNRKHGGRLSPNQTDIDLEYWWQDMEEGVRHDEPFFELELAGTPFEDPGKERTWILTDEGWVIADNAKSQGPGVIAVQSSVDDKILCLAWTNASGVNSENTRIGVWLENVAIATSKRYHVRGKIYLIDNTLEVLEDRIRKELK